MQCKSEDQKSSFIMYFMDVFPDEADTRHGRHTLLTSQGVPSERPVSHQTAVCGVRERESAFAS